MTIIEQIQAGLQRKFPGADTATLTRIATKKAEGVTDEAQVDSIVEGINLTDVMNNYGDFRAGQAQASAVTNYEKKHGLKDGKPAGKPGTDDRKDGDKDDDVPSWARTLIDANKTLSDKLVAYEAREAQAQRNAQITAAAKKYGIPAYILRDRAIPEATDLDTYMKDVKQEMVNDGYQEHKAPEPAEARLQKENETIAGMIAEGTKTIVEQQNK